MRLFSRFGRSRGATPGPSPSPSPAPTPATTPTPPIPQPGNTRLPGDTPIKPQKHQLLNPAELRQLRELIRLRYRLDVEIWADRRMKGFQRDRAKENIRKSTAALARIQLTVEMWDKREYFNTDEEYLQFRELKERLLKNDGKRDWNVHPPWDEAPPGRASGSTNGTRRTGPGMLDQANYG